MGQCQRCKGKGVVEYRGKVTICPVCLWHEAKPAPPEPASPHVNMDEIGRGKKYASVSAWEAATDRDLVPPEPAVQDAGLIAEALFPHKYDAIPVQADNAWCRDWVAEAIEKDRAQWQARIAKPAPPEQAVPMRSHDALQRSLGALYAQVPESVAFDVGVKVRAHVDELQARIAKCTCGAFNKERDDE